MKYLTLVLCHNEVHVIKLFESLKEAEEETIDLANEWYNKDGVMEYLPHQIETIEDMKSYYQSNSYYNSEDYTHIVLEKLSL